MAIQQPEDSSATVYRSITAAALTNPEAAYSDTVVHEQLMDFFDREGVLSDYLFGFRRGRSTEDLLAEATSDWSVARAKR